MFNWLNEVMAFFLSGVDSAAPMGGFGVYWISTILFFFVGSVFIVLLGFSVKWGFSFIINTLEERSYLLDLERLRSLQSEEV